MLKKSIRATFALFCLLVALPSSAAVILSSDFTGTSGDPGNVTWTENDVSVVNSLDPKDSSLNSLALFSNSTNIFAVDHNVHTQSEWFVDIIVSASALVEDIIVDSLSLDVSIFNNSGRLQATQRDLSFSLDVIDQFGVMFSDTVDVFNGDNEDSGFVATESIEFNLFGLILEGGENYTLRLTASGTGGGNNAGFDNFLLLGASNAVSPVNVSAPGTLLLLLTSLALLFFRAKKYV